MYKLITFYAFILGMSSPTHGHTLRDCDELVASDVQIYSYKDQILSPESAAAVNRIAERLNEMINSSEPGIAALYNEIRPEIQSAIDTVQEVKATGYDQVAVSRLVKLFADLVTMPLTYLRDLADLATGGCSDSCLDYSFDFHKSMVLELEERFGPGAAGKFLTSWLQVFKENVGRRPRRDLTRRKFMLSGYYENREWSRNFFFQYRYLYVSRALDLMDFVKIRETGTVFVEVKEGLRGDHDESYDTMDGYIEHDYVHAHLQKIQDARLFDAYGIKNAVEATKLKQANHLKLMELLAAWEKIEDEKLKVAVELILFAGLHEEAYSYPQQLKMALDLKEVRDRHVRLLANSVSQGAMGRRRQSILAGHENESLRAAIWWLRPRLKSHLDDVSIK